MCFECYGDWKPTNWYEDKEPSKDPSCCDECGATIAAGAWRYWCRGEQLGVCRRCEQAGVLDGDCNCEEPDLGEVFEYVRCEGCDKLLKAVEAREKDEGCPDFASRPMLGELEYAFTDHEQQFDYAEKAVSMFPELFEHPFISELLLT